MNDEKQQMRKENPDFEWIQQPKKLFFYNVDPREKIEYYIMVDR